MSVETIARRYSGALVDVVSRSGEAGTVRAELKTWEDLLKSGSDLKGLDNPTIDHKLKEKVVEELIARTRPTVTTANFLRVLVRNRRLRFLPEINSQFAKDLDERGGSMQASVTSARELSDSERSELIRNLAKLTGKQIRADYQVDAAIIGGVVAQIGSTVYDGSVKTKLESLREQLVNG